ncbi:D-2-hydroxyglutarate dehydrogenase, mitochondrial [Smittium culicis]|uniref:D-2-hydroxyglutarate dehydrogenase, mitochondrial n=1 Tax=Smittium culicis TaxID=133412 RepID=A0A1R1XVB8_9FUNG|nr:D-2-hydroxyglutarate dehydrogenase, mitochondrial [Smittium culicis]
MNKIRSLDPDSGAIVCDSGCVLQVLDSYLNDYGLCMPLDLGAKGSCHIGGNVSTNAGGINYIKHGSLHGSILGLEVVLPDGKILNNLSTLRKDSTGYDIKQLFIGAEGTLGVITGVSLLAPKRVDLAFLSFFPQKLPAFEYWDSISMDTTLKAITRNNPLESNHSFYVMIETGGSNSDHNSEKVMSLLEELFDPKIIENGIISQDTTQAESIINTRESMQQGLLRNGTVFAYDISISPSLFLKSVEDLGKYLAQKNIYNGIPGVSFSTGSQIVKFVSGFGHLGDGNLHINVVLDRFDKDVESLVEDYLYDWVRNVNGSISAEHGLGSMKNDSIKYSKTTEVVNIMRNIKRMFDPNGIMNPYKVIPI